MKKVFIATLRIAVDADALGTNPSEIEAEEWLSFILRPNKSIYDWAYGHRAGSFTVPEPVDVDESKYEEGDLFIKGGILEELKKVQTCPMKDLPLLVGSFKHHAAVACLEQRLKGGR